MKTSGILLLGLIIFFATSCDKKTEEQPTITISDLAGSWTATSSVYTNNANPSQIIDLIAIGGELDITILENGGVRNWFTLDSFSDEWDAQAVITDNTVTLTPAEPERGTKTYDFEYNNNTLKLTNHNASFDFTLSGADEVSATSVTTFVRK